MARAAACPRRALRAPEAAAVAAIVAVAAGLRFSALGHQSFWLDEAFTRSLVGRSFGGMLSALPSAESTPPLYYVLVWPWSRLFGTGEAALRSLSALLGTATVWLVYAATRDTLRQRGRVLLAAFAATSPFLVWYSQEARAYALVALLAVASFACLARALARPQRRRWLWLWAASAAGALATHYFAVFLVVAEAAWLVWRAPSRRRVAPAVAAVAAVVAALVPLVLAQRSNNGASGFAQSALSGRLASVPREFLVGPYGGPVRGLAPIAVAAVVAALLLTVRAERGRLALPATLAACTLVLPLLLAAAGFDYVIPRHLIVAWPFVFMLVAAGATAGRAGVVAAGVILAVFAVASIAVPLTPRLERDDWRGAAAALRRGATPRVIVVSPLVGFIPLALYAPSLSATPGQRFAVAEIDLLAMTRGGARPALMPPAPGFALVERRDAPTYSLARYRAAAPRTVTRAELLRHRLTGEAIGLVYEATSARPGARRPPRPPA